ncbi:hypothetical protein ACICHK_43350 (plasmid) [Streptomyces sp. AHU1]|uniref:hypothetical protein n=1 Tax=Streptomyces sp. AHU1 TaxID=3377215 RepID=UPI0038781B11
MNSHSEKLMWTREQNLSAYEARALRNKVQVIPSAIKAYLTDHDVSEALAIHQMLQLVEEAAFHGDVQTKPAEELMRLALPRRIGRYHVMIDTRTLRLFAYSNHSGTQTWMAARTLADSASAAAAQLMQEQKKARWRRPKSLLPCLTWDGNLVSLPEPAVSLRRWHHLRQVQVANMVIRRAVPDCVYFSTVPNGERLTLIRTQLEFLLERVSQRHVAWHPDSVTLEDGPIAWHLRCDGRLLEQITVRRGYAAARHGGIGGGVSRAGQR